MRWLHRVRSSHPGCAGTSLRLLADLRQRGLRATPLLLERLELIVCRLSVGPFAKVDTGRAVE